MKPKQPHSNETQEQVLRAARERVSLRGIERIFNVCRQTGAKWIRDYIKQLPVIADTLLLYEVGDVLEIDGLWSFVGEKEQKRWVWVALCRRTRQIVAFYIGKRDEQATRQLKQRIPFPYTLCPILRMSMLLMMAFCLNTYIGQKRKRVVQPLISRGGTTPYVNDSHVLSVKLCPFPSATSCTAFCWSGLLLSTI